jgi:purine-binding chemotaxis protein CheW
LTLRARDQIFALPLEFVRSIFEIEALTRVPLAPSHLVGLTNWRGGIVAIVCLSRSLDSEAPALGVGALAVAIDVGSETFALAVPEIGDVVRVRAEDITVEPTSISSRGPVVTAGAIRSGVTHVPVLDPFSLFDQCCCAESGQFNLRRPI